MYSSENYSNRARRLRRRLEIVRFQAIARLMPKPDSYDLGHAALGAIKLDGLKISEVSIIFNISRSTISLWLKQQSETDDFQALPNKPLVNGHKITAAGKIPRICPNSWG